MRFAELVAAYGRLEATSKRLEMRSILIELLKALPREDLPTAVYLSQGALRPEYEGVELGVADSLARRAVATVTGAKPSEIAESVRTTGDLGTTIQQLLGRRASLQTGPALELEHVYQGLERIARAAGEGSQEVKVATLVELLRRASADEAKFLVRFVLGTLRLGVREMTILDALAFAFADGSKEARARVEGAFNLSSDLGMVARSLADGGLDGVSAIRVEVGRPIRPMLAERARDLPELLKRLEGRAAVEYKYDGLRIQAHVPAKGAVTLFSRRLENISAQFPELLAELPKAVRHRPAILEGECVPIDPETEEIRPFQEVSRRRGRKHDLDKVQSEIPVSLFLFDMLLNGGTAILDRPFPERRKALVDGVRPTERVRVAGQTIVDSPEEAQHEFDAAIAAGCEGIMGKSVADGSLYRAGARGFWWIKYKRDYTQALADTIDGVVVGAFFGRGRRAGGYGALLLAAYDPKEDRYESFCKVGGGFDDATVALLPEKLRPLEVAEKPKDVVTELEPDRWVRPKLVLEVTGAELTLSPIHRAALGRIRAGAGLALRFPRFTGRWRDDKGPTEATTADELLRLYRTQVRQASSDDSGEESASSPS
ncbi:MAG TPA: ATP-dependent DNA ligase [Thermoplasmata archaeon]|nr:ATP-dependent DNA ligase [Thermoplasmata archaeon]